MHQRQLGPFNISAIGLGCMNICMGYGKPLEAKAAGTLLNTALDNGYTFLDTASMYGNSERLMGKYIAHRRHEYTLASKCGIFKNDEGITETNGRPEILRKTCEDSLARLKTDVIDLYYLHRIDPNVPIEESVGEMSRMVEEGKVRTLGLSEVSTESLKKAHAIHPITALQSEYSLWSRTPERQILAACKELGVTFVPFSPLARQFLTGKAMDVNTLDESDIRANIARPRFEPAAFAANAELLKPYAVIAQREECTMAQLALAWLLAKDESYIPIPGTKNLDYLLENAGASEIMLSADTVQELDNLINEETVSGNRYTDALMASTDSERD